MLEQETQKKSVEIEIYIPPGPRLGDLVIEASKVRKSFGKKLLVSDMTFKIPPAAIVGIIGANGTGKTTLFRMIIGDEKPDAGTIRVGDTVKLAYVEQSRSDLKDNDSVWQSISDGADLIRLGSITTNSRAYVSRFGFIGQDQQQPVGTLSGGEPPTASTSPACLSPAATSYF